MALSHTTQITVHADAEYQYTVSIGEENELIYQELSAKPKSTIITFGTKEEMIAVARAMLKAADTDDRL